MSTIRELVKERIEDLFKDYEAPEEISELTEKSIFNYSVKVCNEPSWENELFISLYKNNALKVIDNLSNNPNTPLIWQMIESGDLMPEEIITVSPEILDPERWEKARRTIIEKVKFAKLDPKTMADGIHQCGKCKSWKTSYYQRQLRSSDEPLNIFMTCLECYHRVKF